MNATVRESMKTATAHIDGAKNMRHEVAGQFAIAYAILYGMRIIAEAIFCS